MPITVDCGEGKHEICSGSGRTAYLIPQESRDHDEPPFNCGCRCHHDGRGVACQECPPLVCEDCGQTGHNRVHYDKT